MSDVKRQKIEPKMVYAETFNCTECQTGRFVIQDQALVGLCLDCGATERTDIRQLHSIKATAMAHLESGKAALVDGRRLDAEESLLDGHRVLEKVAHRSSELFNELKGKLAECYAKMSDWPQAIHYTLERLELFKQIYDEQSAILSAEMCKLSDFQWEMFDRLERRDEELAMGRACLVTTSNALKLIEGQTTPLVDKVQLVNRLKERLLFCYLFDRNLNGTCQVPLEQAVGKLTSATDDQKKALAFALNQSRIAAINVDGGENDQMIEDPFDI